MSRSEAARRSDPIDALRESGMREFVRLAPLPGLPCTVELSAASGRLFSSRVPVDLSLGGVGIRLRWWEVRRAQINTPLSITLRLGIREIRLVGRLVHISHVGTGWRTEHFVGVAFGRDGAFLEAVSTLGNYLLKLQEAQARRSPLAP